jgi:hypothetical protein
MNLWGNSAPFFSCCPYQHSWRAFYQLGSSSSVALISVPQVCASWKTKQAYALREKLVREGCNGRLQPHPAAFVKLFAQLKGSSPEYDD